MNYIKKIAICIVLLRLLFLAACGAESKPEQLLSKEMTTQETGSESQQEQISSKLVDYERLGIKEYEYPSAFFMGDNLETAIIQLALGYKNFGEDSVDNGAWKEIFVAYFIQNSRLSFDYLDMISEKNNGQVSAEQLNYIQYSLTNTEVDFSSFADKPVNRNKSASSFSYGRLTGYDYEETDSGVILTARLEVEYDGTNSIQEREITVELIKNPYSCFDGYSVAAVSSKDITPNAEKAAAINGSGTVESVN